MNDSELRFDESVPVATIEERDPAEEAIPESERVAVQRQVVAELADQQAASRLTSAADPSRTFAGTRAETTSPVCRRFTTGRTVWRSVRRAMRCSRTCRSPSRRHQPLRQ